MAYGQHRLQARDQMRARESLVRWLRWVYFVTSALWTGMILFMWIRGEASRTSLIATALGSVFWVLGFWNYRRIKRGL